MIRRICSGIVRPGERLADVLAESIRREIHRQLDELIARQQRCPYVPADMGGNHAEDETETDSET